LSDEGQPRRTGTAAAQGITKAEALSKGLEVKSMEFVKQGAKVYHKA
jgi:phosphomethylpyrimidine synthase